ncbi:zinc-binding alcohol dehydrogenase family protein [Intrasporangium flavum]|uniref:zinc-binding alcohol dehydrogenase family protein n=1 Tax=Intrasporangium flavum TaxID=1428657 RepID=UPI001F609F4C|nr:zinc-binding alcohol dehydrogenase family protein [Intrasporangium flavum]
MSGLPETMRAVVLRGPGGTDALELQELAVPVPEEGWVLIRVRAFGINRSELHTRLGLAEGVTFPRVPGIEATGEVVACPGGEFALGQQVVAMMGGMGRTFDGGYAEFTCVPARQVIPFRSELPWELLGAVPEMLQTAHGSLTTGLDAQQGQSLLVRGGTSSVGMAAAILAKQRGLTVISTTRTPAKAERLRQIGVDHVVIDHGTVAPAVREILPAGADLALELVGAPTLRDTLLSLRTHGVACFTGMLSNAWVIESFYPIDFLPAGVRLTAYSGDASDLTSEVLQDYLDAAAADRGIIPLDRVFALEEIGAAHDHMEGNRATGKIVVVP